MQREICRSLLYVTMMTDVSGGDLIFHCHNPWQPLVLFD